MSRSSPINYENLVEQALRRVVRDSLAIVAAEGLHGASHFYISFNTKQQGVKMADHLLSAHGDKMTIIVQHQYWDLTVRDNDFDITLSFNHRPEVLTIPYTAIIEFSDPAAGFALQIAPLVANKNSSGGAKSTAKLGKPNAKANSNAAAANKPAAMPVALPKNSKAKAKTGSTGKAGGADVVQLDSFRKKR